MDTVAQVSALADAAIAPRTSPVLSFEFTCAAYTIDTIPSGQQQKIVTRMALVRWLRTVRLVLHGRLVTDRFVSRRCLLQVRYSRFRAAVDVRAADRSPGVLQGHRERPAAGGTLHVDQPAAARCRRIARRAGAGAGL